MNRPGRPKKSLGQNFLTDPAIQKKIVDALDPQADDVILEIGPGQGALTQHLVERVGRVIAVELDDELAPALRHRFRDQPNFEIVHGDALAFDPVAHGLDPRSLKVVGNIPYNITTPLLFRLLERAQRPALLVVMVQKEVAARIVAPPGSSEFGALSVGVQTVGHAERLFLVGRGAFRPAPRVDSAVVRIRPLDPPPLTPDEEIDLRTLTRTSFSWRRKQLQKTLRSAPAYGLTAEQLQQVLARLGLDPEARPETLAPDRFIGLARELRRLGLPKESDTP